MCILCLNKEYTHWHKTHGLSYFKHIFKKANTFKYKTMKRNGKLTIRRFNGMAQAFHIEGSMIVPFENICNVKIQNFTIIMIKC
jgi:hypothetical protein